MITSLRLLVICVPLLSTSASALSSLSASRAIASVRKPSASHSTTKVWRILGRAGVVIGSDRVTIHVPDIKRHGLRAIKVQVTGATAPLRIESLRIRFVDGHSREAEIGTAISAGGETRTIELEAAGARAVEIDYRSNVVSASRPRIATLLLLGRS